ncbi:MAG: AGE family epimerase/isomerase [Robiginitomaculum sp.]|nr:AGE family epimerase/isomerase [Robiginitomaculum sp.]
MPIDTSPQKFVNWCRSTLLTFWAEHGVDRRFGGFFEQANMDGSMDRNCPRRVRVTSRQIYAFAHADTLGWADHKSLVLNSVDWLFERCWRADGEPGFFHLADETGKMLDSRRDLYDHAFHILGLSWAYQASGDPQVLSLAKQVLAFVEEALAAKNEGWYEDLTQTQPRRQNPHMHMYEALLALYTATKDPAYLARADEISQLLTEVFIDHDTGYLFEFFNEKWQPNAKNQIEPGHMAEWSWLLHQRQRLAPDNGNLTPADGLLPLAEKIGLQQNGLLLDQCDTHGHASAQTCRLWGQTERLKAHVILAKAEPDPKINGIIKTIFTHYLQSKVPGLWVDAVSAHGEALSQHVPASIVYHLVSAAAEVERVYCTKKNS